MNFITDKIGREIEPTNPLPVRDTGFAHEREAVSETVTFITGAAGFAGKVSLDKGPIANLAGDNVGSFWRKERNLRAKNCATAKVTAVVETAASATVTIVDTERNLEQLFESPAATARAVIELTDTSGGTLYGYIGGVAASSGTYTIDIYSEAALSTQSWVGTLGSFTFADGTRFEIYSNESSIAWTTGTILTQEVDLADCLVPENETAFLGGLSNGQYGVDYARGVIYYKKATTGTTDDIDYSILKQYETASISGTVTVDSEFPAAAAITDNFANPTTTNVMSMLMGWDGATWDRLPGNATDGIKVNLGTDNDVGINAGANLIGSVGIDQTTPGTTNKVSLGSDSVNVVPTAGWSQVNVAAYATSLVIKASAGTLKQVFGYNSSASDQFIQLHDAASLPADTAVPEDVIIARAGSNFSIDFGESGKPFATGIVVTNSSTGPTKTIGAADCWYSAQYK